MGMKLSACNRHTSHSFHFEFDLCVAAARVLPGILRIREMLPEIPVDDSGDDAFVIDGIGTGIRFQWPIPMCS